MKSKTEGCNGIVIETLSPFDRIRKAQELVFTVIGCDIDTVYIEGFLDFVSYQIVDGLHLQLGCQPLLDSVDDGKLSVALLGLFEQALGLVEEAGILKRHTHGRRHSLQ